MGSLTEWVSARGIRILSVLVILMTVGFVGYYVWDNYLRPVPSILDKSMAHMEDLVRANPTDPDLRVNVADAYLANGMPKQAIAQYQEALTVAEGHKGALFGLGRAHMALNEDNLATGYFDQVIEIGMRSDIPRLDERLEGALFYVGQIHLRNGRTQEAVEALTQATGLNPMDADAIHVLGQAHQKNGEHREAIARFNRAVQFIPDWTEAYQDMAVSYRALGDDEGRSYPDGMLALLRGDYQEAVERLQVAVTAEPENANAYWALGASYEMLKKPQEALEAYHEAIAADPEHILAQAGAARLEQS